MKRRSAQLRKALTRVLDHAASQRTPLSPASAPRPSVRFRPRLESLEDRRLLAAAVDLASIQGRVFDDFTGNGFDVGEEVANATLVLYRDDGDGVFEPGAGDVVERSTMSDANGLYEFERLTEGNYFVFQPDQPGLGLQSDVSPLITIDAEAVKGTITTTIDTFDLTSQLVRDEIDDGIPVTSSVAAPEAIGNERDLLVNKTSTNGAVQLSVDDPLLPNQLAFDSIATGAGDRRITWDGIDGDATTVNDTGLANVDLAANSVGVQLQIRADLAGGDAIVRLYSDDGVVGTATRFSTATLPIPATSGTFLSAELIPFSNFVATSGGGVDLNNVTAIELEITGAADVNGAAELVGSVGSTTFTQNFANFESADLSLSKLVDDATPTVGQAVTFTFTVSNSGPDAATGVMVTDVLPPGIEFNSFATANGTYNSTNGQWTPGTINNGQVATLTITGTVTSVGAKTNSAEITASDQLDPDSTPDNNVASEDDQASVTLLPQTIDLSLSKIVDDAAPNVGETVNFTITLRNDGPDTATNVAVRDLLPSGLTLLSGVPTSGNYNTTSGVWSVPALASGAVETLTIAATVNATGSLTNTAEVTAADQTDTDSTPNNNLPSEDDQASVSLVPAIADLSLSKQVSASAPNVGDEVFFTVTIDNAGPDPATGVIVSDQLPAGLTLVEATVNAGDYDEATGIWSVGSVLVGAAPTLTLRARVDSASPATNTAQITTADQADPDSTPGNNQLAEDDQEAVTVTPPVIDLSLTKSVAPLRVNLGDEVEYTLTLANAGPNLATGIVVNDLLPSGVTFLSATESTGVYNPGTGNWAVDTLAAGASTTLLLRARVDSADAATNTAAIIAADQFDSDSTPDNNVPAEDDQTSVAFAVASADLSLSKTASDTAPNVGEEVSFVITVTNAGPDAATGVVVRDQLPAGTTLVSATESSGTYDVASGLWSIASLASGGSATLTLLATADASTVVINTAEVIAVDQQDPDSTPNNGEVDEDDFATAQIQAQLIDLSLTKTIDEPRPNVGSEATFTLTLRNDGPSAATGVRVTDTLPAGVTLLSSVASQGSFNPATGVWTAGTLGLGEQQTLELVTRIDEIIDSGANIAEVSAADQPDVDSTPANGVANEDDRAAVAFSTPQADLSLTKAVSDAEANVGDVVTFSVQLNNAGPDAASGILVRDSLPVGLEFVSSNATTGSYDAATGIWTVDTLASGAGATLEINSTVLSQSPSTNTAAITAADQADPDSTPGNNVASEDDQASIVVTPPASDLSLTKTVSSARPALGETVTFTVTVNNAGPSTATGITVTDTLPDGVTLVDNQTATGSFNPASGVWTIASLPADTTATLELMATIDEFAVQTNTAEITAADQFDIDSTPGNGVVSEDDFATVSLTPASADLSLTKTINDSTPNVGEEVVFTLTARNAGPDAAADISVGDGLPAGLTFVSSEPSVGSYNPINGVWTIPSLPVGGSSTLLIRATVDAFGDLTNSAEILASSQFDPDSTPGNDDPGEDDQASVSLSPQLVDLALTKGVDEVLPNVGDRIVYTLGLSNEGPSDATGVTIRDQLPAGVVFASATASQGSYNAATGIWTVGAVPVGATPTLQISATVGSIAGATNTAEILTIDQPDADSTPDNNVPSEDDQASATFTTQVADLSLTKSVDNPAPNRNDPVRFTVTLANAGPNDATEITVRDFLPPGLILVSSSTAQGTYNEVTGLWSVSSLPAGSNATLELIAEVTQASPVTNTAEILTASQFDPDSTPGNAAIGEDDFATVTVTPPLVDIAVSAAVDNEAPLEGDVVTITLSASNAGPTDATGVVASALLPDGLTVLSAQTASGSYNTITGEWNIGSLDAGETAELTISARVDTRGLKFLPLEVIATDQFDVDSTPANDVEAEDDQVELVIRAPRLLTKRLFLSR